MSAAVCLATDCHKPAEKRGLCGACYKAAHRHGPTADAGALALWSALLPPPSPQAAAARAKRRPTQPRPSADVGAQLAVWAADGTLPRLLLPWASEGDQHARRTVAGALVASVEPGDGRADLHVAAPGTAPGGDCQGWALDVAGALAAADAIARGMGWRLL